MQAEMVETPLGGVVGDDEGEEEGGGGADERDDERDEESVDDVPLEEAIERAVRQVTQTFSKPAPDRDRLFLAVQSVVSGDMTIKVSFASLQSVDSLRIHSSLPPPPHPTATATYRPPSGSRGDLPVRHFDYAPVRSSSESDARRARPTGQDQSTDDATSSADSARRARRGAIAAAATAPPVVGRR